MMQKTDGSASADRNDHSRVTPGYCLPVGERAAILILAMFVLFVLSVPKFDLPGVLAFAAFPVLLVTAWGASSGTLLRRLMLISPFILFMAGANLVLDRQPAIAFSGFTITGGMLSGAVIVTKSLVTLSTLLSILSSMPFHQFGMALRGLGVPEVFVTQLVLVYRYSELLSAEALSMQRARDMRSFGGRGKELVTTAGLIGSLLTRTVSRAERIYRAMCARGFEEGIGSVKPPPLTRRERGVLAGSALAFLIIRIIF